MNFEPKVELIEIPSYRVASIGNTALTFIPDKQKLSITEQTKDIGKRLLEWANTADLSRNEVPGIFGLSIIEGGWKAPSSEKAVGASREQSQIFYQALLLNQNIMAIPDLLRYSSKKISNNEIIIQHTEPGLYAVSRHKGAYDSLSKLAEELMIKWLPTSGYSYNNKAIINLYRNNPDTTPQEELITDFCIPLSGFKKLPLGLITSRIN